MGKNRGERKKYDTLGKKYTDQFGNNIIQISDILFYKFGELPSYKSDKIEAIVLREDDTLETLQYKRITSKNEIENLQKDYINPQRLSRYDYDADESRAASEKEIWIGVVYPKLSAVNWIGYYRVDNRQNVSLWLSYMNDGELYIVPESNAKAILQYISGN